MSSSLGHQGQSKAPSPTNASGEPSFKHSALQGSSHFDSPLPVTASNVLQRNLPTGTAQRRIVLLEAELRGSKQDIAQLERDITRLTKDLRTQRNQIIVFEREEVDFQEKITQLETENEMLRQQGSESARVQDLETQVGTFAANRKTVEEGIIMNVSVDMDTIIEAVHDLKAGICEAVRAQFAAGIGKIADNLEGNAKGHLEQNVQTIDKSDHTRTIPGPSSVAQDQQSILPSPGTQLAFNTYRKPPEIVSKARPQQEDTLDHEAFRIRPGPFSKALVDNLHRFLIPSPSSDLVVSRMEPKDTFEAAIENMSDSDFSITTTLVPQADKSLAKKPRGLERTEPLSLGSSTPEDNVIPVLSPGKPAGLLRKSATGSPMSSTPRERVTSGKWNPSPNPKASIRYGGLRVDSDEEYSLPWTKRRRTDR